MKLALCGLGKAGTTFARYVTEQKTDELVCVLCRDQSSTAGKTVSEVAGIVTAQELIIRKISDFDNRQVDIDVLIDFSASSTSLELLDLCCKNKINLVICPTNFSDEQLKGIEEKVQQNGIGVVYAPTLTRGVNILMKFVNSLANYGDYHFEIVERHSKNKATPTKTAQYISEAIHREDTHISSVRLDGYVGIHEVSATDGYERITIVHESFSREAFVKGALRCAAFIKDKKGFYQIKDIHI